MDHRLRFKCVASGPTTTGSIVVGASAMQACAEKDCRNGVIESMLDAPAIVSYVTSRFWSASSRTETKV